MTESTLTSLLIVDDHPLFRKGVKQLLSDAGGFELVGEASSGEEGIDLAYRYQPELILLDLNMKDMQGLDVLKVLKAADIDSRIIMLTVSDQQEDLVAALRAGADGYLLKDMEPEDLAKKRNIPFTTGVVSEGMAKIMARQGKISGRATGARLDAPGGSGRWAGSAGFAATLSG